jgi:hypothetical protein
MDQDSSVDPVLNPLSPHWVLPSRPRLTSDVKALLAGCFQSWTEKTAKLVLADAIEESGFEPWAQLIRITVELEDSPENQSSAIADRIAELSRPENLTLWSELVVPGHQEAVPGSEVRFECGLPAYLAIPVEIEGQHCALSFPISAVSPEAGAGVDVTRVANLREQIANLNPHLFLGPEIEREVFERRWAETMAALGPGGSSEAAVVLAQVFANAIHTTPDGWEFLSNALLPALSVTDPQPGPSEITTLIDAAVSYRVSAIEQYPAENMRFVYSGFPWVVASMGSAVSLETSQEMFATAERLLRNGYDIWDVYAFGFSPALGATRLPIAAEVFQRLEPAIVRLVDATENRGWEPGSVLLEQLSPLLRAMDGGNSIDAVISTISKVTASLES